MPEKHPRPVIQQPSLWAESASPPLEQAVREAQCIYPSEQLPPHDTFGPASRFRFGKTICDIYASPKEKDTTPVVTIGTPGSRISVSGLTAVTLLAGEQPGITLTTPTTAIHIRRNGSYLASYSAPETLSPPTPANGQETHQEKPLLPFDPDVQAFIPEDMKAFVTHIPRYLQPPEKQKASVVDLIHTRFFLLSYDDYQRVRHHIGGTLLADEQGGTPQPLLYMGVPHTLDRAIAHLREALANQGLLPTSGKEKSEPEKRATSQGALTVPHDLAQLVSLVPTEGVYEKERTGIEIPTRFYIFQTQENGRTLFVPGIVTERDELAQKLEIMSYFHAKSQDIERVYGFLREAAINLGLLDAPPPANTLPLPKTEDAAEATQEFLTTYQEKLPEALPQERPKEATKEPPHPLPFNVRKLVKVTNLSTMSKAKRAEHVIKEPLCIIAMKGKYDGVIRYKAGIIAERNEETKRQTKVDWLTEEVTDVNLAWQALETAVVQRGWTKRDLQPLDLIPAPKPKREPEGPTPEEVAAEPLLAILRREEIYHDPYEVTIEEAEENNFPLLRRDVSSHIWWLEFPYDTRDDPELDSALKDNGWRWGGYHQQMFHRDPYAHVPQGLYFANAGPCEYAADREKRYEKRRSAAVTHSNAHYSQFQKMASVIPFGQPMMPDHYSYNRDRNYRNKIARQMDKAISYYRKAEWLERRAEGSRREQAYRQTRLAMAERVKRLEADLRGHKRAYEQIKQFVVGEKQPYSETILTEEGKEKALNRYRRYMTITASEMLPLKAAIAEQGGLPIETEEQKPESGALLLMGGKIVVARKITKANKTNITCISYAVPGFTKEGWKGSYPLTSFQRVLLTGNEVDEALKAGKTYAQLTEEWEERLQKEEGEQE